MQFLRRLGSLWILILALCLFAYVSHFNKDRCPVSLPPWIEMISLPSYALVLGSFMFGAVVASLYFGLESAAKTLEVRRLRKEVASLRPATPTEETARTVPARGEGGPKVI